jgi:RNA polymerase sigma-70 factor, ECF subfamily
MHIHDLLARSVAGDEAAFRELYDSLAQTVFAYALRLVSNRAAAEDVMQEAFMALLRGGRTYDPARPFRAWLMTLTRNAAIDYLRRDRRRPCPMDRKHLERAMAPWREPSSDDLVERGLATLPAPYREALWLCDAVGLSYAEAAVVMDCDLGTVGSRVARGRRLLRDFIERNRNAL